METTNTKSLEEVVADRLGKANDALTAYRARIEDLLATGPAYLAEYAKDSWAVVETHTEITKDNAEPIRDGVMAANQTHRAKIYYGLVERGELDTGFALLHDTIHDAANLTNGIYFLSNKW